MFQFFLEKKETEYSFFYIFFLIYFLINLFTSLTLAFSIFSVEQGLLSIVLIYFLSFYFLFKKMKDDKYKLIFLFLIFFSILFWIFAFYPALNGNDDFKAYLFFLERTAVEGSLSIDTLSARRMLSLGGLFPFQGSLSNFDLRFLSIVEPTLGILLTTVAIIYFNKNHFVKLISIIILILSPLLGSKVLANTVGVYTLVFFSYTILNCFALIIKDNNFKNITLTIIFLCTSLSLTIKPIPLIFNSIIIIFSIIFLIKNKKNELKISHVILTSLICFIYILPFFDASFRSSGTFFYPILGDGWRALAEYSPLRYDSFSSINNITEIFSFLIIPFKDVFFIIVFVGIIFYLRNKNIYLQLSLILSYLFFYLVIVFTVGDDISLVRRYTFPISFSLFLFLINFVFKDKNLKINKGKFLYYLSFMSCIVLIFCWLFEGTAVNENRKKIVNSFNLNSMQKDLNKITYLKDDNFKLLINGVQPINFYKNGFKNIIIFDVPFQSLPWLDKRQILLNSNYEKNKIINDFYNHIKKEKITHIITDKVSIDEYNNSSDLLGFFLKSKSKKIDFNHFSLHEIKF